MRSLNYAYDVEKPERLCVEVLTSRNFSVPWARRCFTFQAGRSGLNEVTWHEEGAVFCLGVTLAAFA